MNIVVLPVIHSMFILINFRVFCSEASSEILSYSGTDDGVLGINISSLSTSIWCAVVACSSNQFLSL